MRRPWVSIAAVHSMESLEDHHVQEFKKNPTSERVKQMLTDAYNQKTPERTIEFVQNFRKKLDLKGQFTLNRLYKDSRPDNEDENIKPTIDEFISTGKIDFQGFASLKKVEHGIENAKVITSIKWPELKKLEVSKISDAQDVSVSIQANLNEFKNPNFMVQLQEAIKQLLEKYKNQSEKKQQVDELNKQIQGVQSQLDAAQIEIARGNDNLESAKFQIASFMHDLTLSVSSEDKVRFERVVNNLKIDPELKVDDSIFENLEKIKCDSTVLDQIKPLINNSTDTTFKKYIPQVDIAINSIKNALKDYEQAQETMTNLSDQMITVVNKINELGQSYNNPSDMIVTKAVYILLLC